MPFSGILGSSLIDICILIHMSNLEGLRALFTPHHTIVLASTSTCGLVTNLLDMASMRTTLAFITWLYNHRSQRRTAAMCSDRQLST